MEQEHPAIADLIRRVRVGNGRERLSDGIRRIHALRARLDGERKGLEPASRVGDSTPVPAPPET